MSVSIAAASCSVTEPPAGDRLTGTRYAMQSFAGSPLPAPLDQDTVRGTAHYSMLGDTLVFDGHGSISSTTVIRLEYVDGTPPPLLQVTSGILHYEFPGIRGPPSASVLRALRAH